MHKSKNENHRDAHGNQPGQDNFNIQGNRERTGQNGQDDQDRKKEKTKK